MNAKYCPRCPFFSYQLVRVITHIGLEHSGEPNFSVICGIEGCANTYTNFSSYRSHLYRHHSAVLEENGSNCHQRSLERPRDRRSTELPSSEQLRHEMDSADMHSAEMNGAELPIFRGGYSHRKTPVRNLQSQQTAAPRDHFQRFLEKVKSTIWDFFFSITTKHSLPHAAAVKIFAQLKEVFELVLKAYGNEFMNAMETSVMGPELQNLLGCSFLPDLFNGIESKWKRDNYVKENFPFVPAEEHYVGEDANYHYVPLPKLLTVLCQLPDIAAHLKSPVNIERHETSVYRDHTDGLVFKEHMQSIIPEGSTHTIILLFYTDEIEVVNPLGAKRGKHKILAVYCSLVNIHARYRSQIDNIYLVMLVRYAYVKTHGLGPILQPLLDDLKAMHKEGLVLSVQGREVNARVIVLAFCGDNLSLNRLGGFSCCFSNGRVCRFCMISSKQLAQKTHEDMCQARTLGRHELHLAAVAVNTANRRLYGVNEASPLLQLPYFDVTRQLPPDLMHDILEGGAESVLRQVLRSLLSSRLLSKQDLDLVWAFKYGKNDTKNKPPAINMSFLNSNAVLAGTASSKWCLMRFLPLILGTRIPEGNEDWELLLKFREIIDIIFAAEISSARLAYLDVLVQSFLVDFSARYGPGALIPKLHYMVHYARFVRELGQIGRAHV